MKLKLYDLVASSDALQELGKLKLPAKLAYKISKNIKKVNAELKEYTEAKNSLILNKYGEAEASGNYQVTKENVPAFVKEINELLESEVDVDIFPVELDDSITLSVESMSLLGWLFVDGLPDTPPVINK